MDFLQQFLALKDFFEAKNFILEITGSNSTQTEEEQLKMIRTDIENFKDNGSNHITFYFAKNIDDENRPSFAFVAEYKRVSVTPTSNQRLRSEDCLQNWEDLAGLEVLINKYEEELN